MPSRDRMHGAAWAVWLLACWSMVRSRRPVTRSTITYVIKYNFPPPPPSHSPLIIATEAAASTASATSAASSARCLLQLLKDHLLYVHRLLHLGRAEIQQRWQRDRRLRLLLLQRQIHEILLLPHVLILLRLRLILLVLLVLLLLLMLRVLLLRLILLLLRLVLLQLLPTSPCGEQRSHRRLHRHTQQQSRSATH